MSLKFYMTDWIPELGRYATIIAAFKNLQINKFISESFVFAIDKERQFYKGQRSIYSLPEIPEYNDEASIHDHALRYTEVVIHLHNDEVSNETNKRDIVLKEWKHHEFGGIVVLSEIHRKYQEKLRWLASNTESDELKKIIRLSLKVLGSNPIETEPL